MPVTIRDIAERAKVSKATVSRVMNGKPDVDPQTANRVREAMEKLGYIPSARAIALAKGRANCLGMLVPSMVWPVMLDILRGVAEEVETSSFALMLYTMTRGEESIRDFMTQVVGAKQIDGLAVVVPPGMLDYLADLHSQGLPIVVIDDRGHHPEFPSVTTTNHAGGYTATRHLIETGRTRIATITGPMDYGCSRERLSGYTQALTEAGLTVDPALIANGDFSETCGEEAVRSLLTKDVAFDAIFANNDLSALGAMKALKRAGCRIPDDVAVVGFDDIPSASHTSPPLTTIRQPFYEMGRMAAQLLLETMKGHPLPDTPFEIPTELIVRGSSVSRNVET